MNLHIPQTDMKLSTLLFFIFFTGSLQSQITFEKQYADSTGSSWAYDAIECSDHGFALCGYDYYHSTSPYTGWLIRTDEHGDTLWSQYFPGVGGNLLPTNDAGCFYGSNGSGAYRIRKITSTGSLAWQISYPTTQIMNALIQTAAGDFVIGGSHVVKMDLAGNILFDRTMPTNVKGLVNTPDGQIVCLGTIPNPYSNDIELNKITATGNIAWSKIFSAKLASNNQCLAITEEGDFLLGAQTNWNKGLIIKTNQNGDTLWSRIYDCVQGINSITVTTDGNYAFVGKERDAEKTLLVKTDTRGNIMWKVAYGDSILTANSVSSVHLCHDDGFVIAGGQMMTPTQGDCYLIKTDYEGNTPYHFGNVEQVSSQNLVAYPNPFGDVSCINTAFDPKQATIRLVNDLGQEYPGAVYIHGHQIEISRQVLPTGIYFLNMVYEGNKMCSTKLIVQ